LWAVNQDHAQPQRVGCIQFGAARITAQIAADQQINAQ
jgi:hypothetical protein